MFKSHQNSIMQLVSWRTTLVNQGLNHLSKDIADLKESLEFTQGETEGKFNKLNEKITTMERNLFSLKKDIEVIQTTKPSWAREVENKLVHLKDRSRSNNFKNQWNKRGKKWNGRLWWKGKLLPGGKTAYGH